MAEPDRRTSVRFSVADEYSGKVQNAGGSQVNFRLIDVGLGGCQFTTEKDLGLKIGSSSIVQFKCPDADTNTKSRIAHYQSAKNGQNNWVYGVQFFDPIPPWGLRRATPKLRATHTDSFNRVKLFEHQRDLALLDIQTLQSSVRLLKDKQFQMLLAGLPIFIGLLGTAFAFLPQAESAELVQWWVMLLPFLSALLAWAFLAIFLQKNTSIRRQDAFTHLLQTHLTFGSFPPCYRGWTDAYANYNHYLRYEGSPRYDIPKVPSYFKFRRIVPSDAFSLLSITLLLATPFISLVLMVTLSYYSEPDPTSYTVLVMVTTAGVVTSYGWFIWAYNQTMRGPRSYRSLLLIFDRILNFAPPFDPINKQPLP